MSRAGPVNSPDAAAAPGIRLGDGPAVGGDDAGDRGWRRAGHRTPEVRHCAAGRQLKAGPQLSRGARTIAATPLPERPAANYTDSDLAVSFSRSAQPLGCAGKSPQPPLCRCDRLLDTGPAAIRRATCSADGELRRQVMTEVVFHPHRGQRLLKDLRRCTGKPG